MLESIHWTTAIIGGIFGIVVILAAAFITFGYYRRLIEDHATRLAEGQAEFKAQNEVDIRIEKKIDEIAATCKGRQEDFSRNNTEHCDIYARVNTLEVTVAGMPGLIMRQMEPRFAALGSQINQGMKDIKESLHVNSDQ